jgi:hypothetical protein
VVPGSGGVNTYDDPYETDGVVRTDRASDG